MHLKGNTKCFKTLLQVLPVVNNKRGGKEKGILMPVADRIGIDDL